MRPSPWSSGAIIARVRRLFPEPAADVTVADAYAAHRPPPSDRPWVAVCMVATIDGAAVVTGGSRAISNARDAEVLATLRRLSDVILVGATTAREERYGPPKAPGKRIGVVTASGSVDTTGELFRSGAGFVVTTEDGPGTGDPAIDTIRAGIGTVDLPAALGQLADVVDQPRFVHVEGGPVLNGALFDADCVDELNLTWSPTAIGGARVRIAVGAEERMRDFELAHLLVDEDSFVYSRWVRAGR